MNATCHNCGGNEFYSRDITLMGDAGFMFPAGAFAFSKAQVRVCGTCGLIEWFAKPDTLEKVKQKYLKES